MNEKIVQWVESLASVTAHELPFFIQETAAYGFWSNLRLFILLTALWIGLIKCLFMFIKYVKTIRIGAYDIWPEFCYGAFVISVIICFVISLCCLNYAIKAKVSPRLYVIERFMR